EPRQAPPRGGEQDGGIEPRRNPLPAPENPGRAGDGGRAIRAQRAAVERHRLSGSHISGGILYTHRLGTIGRPDRRRVARPRLHRGQASLLRLRVGTSGESSQVTAEHASPSGRTLGPGRFRRSAKWRGLATYAAEMKYSSLPRTRLAHRALAIRVDPGLFVRPCTGIPRDL